MKDPVRPPATVDFNPFSPDLVRTPYNAYRQLQSDDPVQWNPVINAWVMTRMADVRAVMMDSAFEAIQMAQLLQEITVRTGRDYSSLIGFLDAVLFFKDGAAHARDRRTLATVMNRVRLSELEPIAISMIRANIEAVPRNEPFDAITVLADHFPQAIMAHVLGLPQEDVPTLSRLLSDLTLIFDPASLALYDRLKAKVDEALALVSRRIDHAIAQAEESSLLVIYHSAEGDHAAKLARAAATVLFTYRVGAEATIGLLGTMIKALVDNPDLAQTLRNSPDLIDRFVAESLRLESNVQRAGRVATKACNVNGTAIAEGDRVLLLVGAANRDPAAFDGGDEMRLEEKRAPDLAFGAGKHFCLGASLARMEGRVFVQAMLSLPPLERAGTEEWYLGRTVRRLTTLPIRTIA